MEAELLKTLADLVTVTNVLAAFMAGLVVDLHKAWAKKTPPGPGWWRPFVRLPATGFGRRTVRLAPIGWCVLFMLIPGLYPEDPQGEPVKIGVALGMATFWGVCASWVYGAVMGVVKKREPEPLLPTLPPPQTPRGGLGARTLSAEESRAVSRLPGMTYHPSTGTPPTRGDDERGS